MAISVPKKASVVCLAWSWNDEYVAAGLYDGNVCVWNASTGTRISELFAADGTYNRAHRVFVSSIAFSHDGWQAPKSSRIARLSRRTKP